MSMGCSQSSEYGHGMFSVLFWKDTLTCMCMCGYPSPCTRTFSCTKVAANNEVRNVFLSGVDYWQRKLHRHHSWAMKEVVLTVCLTRQWLDAHAVPAVRPFSPVCAHAAQTLTPGPDFYYYFKSCFINHLFVFSSPALK